MTLHTAQKRLTLSVTGFSTAQRVRKRVHRRNKPKAQRQRRRWAGQAFRNARGAHRRIRSPTQACHRRAGPQNLGWARLWRVVAGSRTAFQTGGPWRRGKCNSGKLQHRRASRGRARCSRPAGIAAGPWPLGGSQHRRGRTGRAGGWWSSGRLRLLSGGTSPLGRAGLDMYMQVLSSCAALFHPREGLQPAAPLLVRTPPLWLRKLLASRVATSWDRIQQRFPDILRCLLTHSLRGTLPGPGSALVCMGRQALELFH